MTVIEQFVAQMETTVVGNATRYYVMAVTPTRLYSFTGIGALEVCNFSQFYLLHLVICVIEIERICEKTTT